MKNLSVFRNLLFMMGFLLFLASCKPNDAEITSSVKSKVEAISGVAVDVKDGVVTLSGQVADDASKAAAEAAVQGVKGMKSVVNNITVTPPPPPPAPVVINPDDVLRGSIDSIFAARGYKGITATVSGGVVTLMGNVKRADLTKVMQAANELKPKQVKNQMNITK